jgi:hypothetical protein
MDSSAPSAAPTPWTGPARPSPRATPSGQPGWGEPISDPNRIADAVAAYREFGADELVLYCYADDPRQVEDLAALVR